MKIELYDRTADTEDGIASVYLQRDRNKSFSEMSKLPVFVMKTGSIERYSLCLGFRGNRGKIAQIVIFAAVGDSFQVFRVSPVGDAYTCDLALLCHGNSLRLGNEGFIRQLVPGDSTAFLHKSYNAFCIGAGLWNLIQCILDEIVLSHIHRSFGHSFCRTTENMLK